MMSDINIIIRLASKSATQGLDQFGRAAKKSSENLSLFQKVIRQGKRSLDSFYGNLGANLAFRAFNGINRAIINTVTNIREFETALVGVGKTTGLAGAELEALGARVEDLSKEIPVASTELLDLSKTAAQLGISGTDNILKFSETLSRLAASTDVVGETGAIAFARIINVTGDSVENIDKLGSSLVALGNNFATTESHILSVANEVAKGGARFGLTAEQVLGLSTAMSALGVESQVAGSTTQKVFTLVEKAIGKGGGELEKFTKILGLNSAEFIKLFKTEPQKFFIELVKGLKASKDGGTELSTSLAELGFQDLRVTKTLGPLIDRVDLLTKATELSTEAFNENKALLEESEAAFATLDGDLQQLDNSWIALTNSLLRAVLPAIKATVKALTSFLEIVGESKVIFDIFKATLIVGAVALTVIAAKVVIATGVFGFLAGALGIATVTATSFWAALLLPITIAIASIAALVAAFQAVRFLMDDTAEATDDISESQEGYNTVLQTAEARTKAVREELEKQNKEFQKQIGLQDILDSKQGTGTGTGSVLDPGKQEAIAAEEAARLAKIEKDKQDKIDEIQRIKDANILKLQELDTFGQLEIEKKLALKAQELEKDRSLTEEERERTLEGLRKEEEDKLTTKQIALKKKLKFDDDARKLELKTQTKNAKREAEVDAEKNKQITNDRKNFWNNLGVISQFGNKSLFELVKKARLAQAVISGFTSIQEAATIAPFPLNLPSIAAATAMSLSNIAAIKSQSFQDGGIVGGNSFSGDNVQANVNSGEMILNRQQQAQLFNQANGLGGGGGQVIEVTSIVQIDETEVGRAVSRQVANGLELGEGGV